MVGRDAYLVFVADGAGGQPGLFAVRADGGAVFPITYSNVAERRPALSPNGLVVAFLRARGARDPHAGAVWVLNLLSGAERELELPADAAPAERVGWSRDGRTLFAQAGASIYRLQAPPHQGNPRPVGGPERPAAESSFSVMLGQPPFATVVPCGSELCVQAESGAGAPLQAGARDAVRWGTDSVGYLLGGQLIVRPVGPGRARVLGWTAVPGRPRELTYFPGKSDSTP